MAVVAYKCPNCGAPLEFSPESQRFECSFCGSSFSEEELQEYEPAQSSEQTIVQEPAEEEGKEETAVLYTCPSCGAQLPVLSQPGGAGGPPAGRVPSRPCDPLCIHPGRGRAPVL